mgnify:CR=1 FL=1
MVIYDISELTNDFAQDEDMNARRRQFDIALQDIKAIAEKEGP